MLEAGHATKEDIDTGMQLGYRWPMGPLRLTDVVGLDVRLAIAEHLTGVDLRDGAAVDTALRAYEDERRPVTDVVMANRKLNKTERSIANKTQDERKEFAESGEFEEMQKKDAKGELDEL